LIVEHMELAGEGLLRLKFEQLKRKLAAEGLFDPEHKQELPWWSARIGVVTSPSGAAIRDILSVLKRRNPTIEVVVYPVSVQGAHAAPEIVGAIRTANLRADCDILIVSRGGGSLEDLWAFNEEAVARAIFASTIPIVSAVGHEIDFTIADLVADLRAPTPSASAELCSPERGEIQRLLAGLEQRISATLTTLLARQQHQLRHLRARLQHPGRRLEHFHQRIDELMQRLPAGLANAMRLRLSALTALTARTNACNPRHRIADFSNRVMTARRRLEAAQRAELIRRQALLDENLRALKAVSPTATLQRGYAIVSDAEGNIARDAAQFRPGDRLDARLAHGRLGVRVDSVAPAQNGNSPLPTADEPQSE
jgi:exodeoxyribonuclease VII large subunit